MFSNLFSLIHLSFAYFVLVVNAQWSVDEEDSCSTPTGANGICSLIDECKPIMDVLDAAPQPLPSSIVTLLRQYQCGFQGRRPKVCCPNGPITLVTPVRTDEEAPPDVSQHRNIGLLPQNCGPLDTGTKIVFGQKAGLFEFPWMALLSYRTNRGPKFKCGATIINNRYILTAAHCIANLQSPLIGVRIGEYDTDKKIDCMKTKEGDEICAPTHQDIAIEEIIPHENYDKKSFTNDIGLLRVSKISFVPENIKPVCLPLENTRSYNFTNRNCIITGWGATETGRNSPILLKVQLPTVSNSECATLYKNVNKISSKQLCAGGKTRSDSCAGDSGGPLQVVANLLGDSRVVQQGVVSFGPRDCGNSALPGVYTRIAYYMDWILDNIRS